MVRVCSYFWFFLEKSHLGKCQHDTHQVCTACLSQLVSNSGPAQTLGIFQRLCLSTLQQRKMHHSHALCHCSFSLRNKRYTWWHNSVLSLIALVLSAHIAEINKSVPTENSQKIFVIKANERQLGSSHKKLQQPSFFDKANYWINWSSWGKLCFPFRN